MNNTDISVKAKRKKPIKVAVIVTVVATILIFAVTAVLIALPMLYRNNSMGDAQSDIGNEVDRNTESDANGSVTLPSPDDEVRGIYIATVQNINFPSTTGLAAEELRLELDDIVSSCKDANLNAIYFQVRPSSDALYDSALFPTSKFITGTQGDALPDGLDPLSYLIEKAEANGIRVHAWVNPLRVTTGSKSKPEHDTQLLAANHPARLHPEYTVPYADGRLYYNCALPEVRKLIADGVAELASNYDIASIIFDDYFYPYPVTCDDGSIAEFDDKTSYEIYGGEASLDDFRRENVNKMIFECYSAIKAANPECEFGVAPFGIWQNNNGTNGGSETSGFEAYSAIYCDPTAWIEGGYIDYLAPQLYWRFTTSAARYDILVRWWNTLLDGTGIKLLISHGVYNYDTWESPENELRNQVGFARSELTYKGSILYGYAALKANSHGLLDEVREVFSEKITYSDAVSTGNDLIISIPYNNSYIDGDNTFVIGTSDPAEPLYVNGVKVGRTKSGYFSLYLPLEDEKNTFIFTHKGGETQHVINKGIKASDTVVYPTLSSPGIHSVSPSTAYAGKGSLEVSVIAPRGSSVTAELSGKKITLSPTLYAPYQKGTYMKEVFIGSFTLSAFDNEIRALGKVKFTSVLGGNTYTAESGEIRALGKDAVIPIEVTGDDTNLKISRDSWYYDDYTAQSCGMRDNAIFLSDGMYKLRCGGLISQSEVRELDVSEIKIAHAESAVMVVDEKATYFKIKVDENIPINCNMEDNGEFCVMLYNMDTSSAPEASFSENPLFTSVRGQKSTKQYSYKYFFKLVNIENFYGFKHYYEDGHLIFEWKNPEALPDTDKPLTDKIIVLDAGHGIENPNALGPLGDTPEAMNEGEFNLEIVLAAEKYLSELGAEVILIRDKDETRDIPLTERTQTLIDLNPDLVISIHQNSMPYTADIRTIHGVVGLYWSDSGYMLTDVIGGVIADSLDKIDRSPTKQRLAMTRNPKFPSTLIETCFITNVEEYERMMKPDACDTIARAISDGVLKYYKSQEKYILN